MLAPEPIHERERFVAELRAVMAAHRGQRLVVHVRRQNALDWKLAVVTAADGSPAFDVGYGRPRDNKPAIVLDAYRWRRPHYFIFAPRSRQLLIDWLQAEVDTHNKEVSGYD